jgi:hypothetical protein
MAIGVVPPTYRELHAAEDVIKFMASRPFSFSAKTLLSGYQEDLRLPPCYLVGLSVGVSIAIQMAQVAPIKFLPGS